jgi:ankyrin repeat protein
MPLFTHKVTVWKAAQQADHQLLRFFLQDCGQDVNKANRNGMTPLHFAAANGDSDTVHLLLSKYQCNPNPINRAGPR